MIGVVYELLRFTDCITNLIIACIEGVCVGVHARARISSSRECVCMKAWTPLY